MNETILRGVVGSTAYGLAREGSDIDRLGVFVAPTEELLGLHWTGAKETRTNAGPGSDDYTEHEVGKFIRLALKCNPTITELLWLPEFEHQTSWGEAIVAGRRHYLSRRLVKDAYLGYASAQARKLAEREDGTFSSDTRKRTAKHGRHMLRLLRQGRQLIETGELTVRVDNPDEYWAFDDLTKDEMLELYRAEEATTRASYESTVLPEEPRESTIEEMLVDLRRVYLDPTFNIYR